MKKLTNYQKEEILGLLDIRQETINDDIESATPFEAMPDALNILAAKIKADDMNFTELEIGWLIEECDFRADMAYANFDSEGVKVMGLANSMQNVIDKITN